MSGAGMAYFCLPFLRVAKFSILSGIAFFCLCYLCSAEPIVKKYSKNLIAYYAFDELDGKTLKDQSGRNHHGSVKVESDFIIVDGVYGNAGRFHHRNGVVIPSTKRLSKGEALTLMLWVKPEVSEGRVKFISKRNYDSQFNYFLMGMNDCSPFGGVGDGDLITATPQTFQIESDEWSHLAFVIGADKTVRFYVNGEVKEVIESDTLGFDTLNASMSLGSDFEGSEDFFSGIMDELIIVGEAIGASEIKEEFERANVVQFSKLTDEMIIKNKDTYLACYFPIDEGRGNSISDKVSGLKGSLLGNLATEWSEEFLKSSVELNETGWIEIPHSSHLNFKKALSVSVWIKPTRFGQRKKIIYKGEKSSLLKFFTLGEDNGVLYAAMGDGSLVVLTEKKTKLLENEWQQVGLIFDLKRKQLDLIHNGEVKESVSVSFPVVSGTSAMLIGNEPEQQGNGFNGYISDLRMYPISIPPKIFKDDYVLVKRQIEVAKKERLWRKKIQEDLKKAYLELRELDRILGEDSQIVETAGKESLTFSKVMKLIEEKKQRLKDREQKERVKFAEMIERLNSKKGVLNILLSELNQDIYHKDFPPSTKNLAFEQLIKDANQLSHFEVEIDLLIKQKQKEVELKKELIRKKEERIKGQIDELLKLINGMEIELNLPPTEIDNTKMSQDGDQYKIELESVLNKVSLKRDTLIADLKVTIKDYRSQIQDLKTQIDSIAELIAKPKCKEVDLTSPLVDDVARLSKIKEYEEDVIAEFNQQLTEYKKIGQQVFGQLKNEVMSFLESSGGILENVHELELKLNMPPSQYRFPDMEELKQSSDLKLWLNAKTSLTSISSEMKIRFSALEAEDKKRLVKQAEEEMAQLKKRWSDLSSELALINDELGIRESYKMPQLVSGSAMNQSGPEYYFSFDSAVSKSLSESIQGTLKMDLFNILEDQWQEGSRNLGLRLDGIRSFGVIDFKGEKSVDNFSFGIAINVLQFWGERSIVNIADNAGNRALELRLFEKELQLVGNGVILGSDFQEGLRVWKNITVVFEGGTGKASLYVDSVLKGSKNLNMSHLNFTKIQVGGSPLNEDVFYGLVDELKWSFKKISENDMAYWEGDTWFKSKSDNVIHFADSLKQKIAEMERKKNERSQNLKSIRDAQKRKIEEARDKYLEKVKQLNGILKQLGLPEVPEIPPKEGVEIEALTKIESEMSKRQQQLSEKNEEEQAKIKSLKNEWYEVSSQLKEVYAGLNVTRAVPELPEDHILEEKLSEMKKMLEKFRAELVQKRNQELSQMIETSKVMMEGKIKSYQGMLTRIGNLQVKIQEIHARLGEAYNANMYEMPWNEEVREFAQSYFTFDHVSGPVEFSDSSYLSYVYATRAHSLKSDDSGRFGKCLVLENLNEAVKLDQYLVNDSFSIMVWVSLSQIKDWVKILSLEGSDDKHVLELQYSEGQFMIEARKRKTIVKKWDLGRSNIKSADWMHLALVIDKIQNTLGFYVNGSRQDQINIELLNQFNWNLVLGSDQIETVERVATDIHMRYDELRIYDKSVESKEIIKYGNVEEFDSLEKRYDYVTKKSEELEKIFNEKTLKIKEIEDKERLLAEQKYKGFIKSLNALNALHKKLGEAEESEKDYELFDSAYRELVLKSRIRRATSRIEEIEAANEAHENEYVKISSEIEDLWEKITQFTHDLKQKVDKPVYTRETADTILNQVREMYKNKEAEWQAWKTKNEQEIKQAKIKSRELIEKIEAMRADMGTPLTRGFELSDTVVVETLKEVELEFKNTTGLYEDFQMQRKKSFLEKILTLKQKINANLSRIINMSAQMGTEEKLSQVKKIYGVEDIDFKLLHYFDNLENGISFDQNYLGFFEINNAKLEFDEVSYLKLAGQGALATSSSITLRHAENGKASEVIQVKINVRIDERYHQSQVIFRMIFDNHTSVSLIKHNKDMLLEVIQDDVKANYPLKFVLPSKAWVELNCMITMDSKMQLKFLKNGKEEASVPLKASHMFDNLKIEFGSKSESYFNFSEISMVSVTSGKIDVPFNQIVNKASYSDKALGILSEISAMAVERLKKLEEIWEEDRKLKEDRRQKILDDIEKIKQEFKTYAPNEKLTVAIELGQEEKALQDLIKKLSQAKLQYEERLKEEARVQKENQKKIRDFEAKLEEFRKKAGIGEKNVKPDGMKDADYIKLLESEMAKAEAKLREQEKEKRERDLALKLKRDKLVQEINEIRAKLDIQTSEALPSEISDLEKILYDLNRRRDEKRQKEEMQLFDRQMQKWKINRDIYREILSGIGETPESMAEPVANQIEDALSTMELKLGEARELAKSRVQAFKNQFESLIGELKPVLAELGANISMPVFDTNHSYKSVEKMKILLEEQKNALSMQKLKESEALKNIEQSADKIKQAIDREKDEIRKYVKDLEINQYQFPTIRKQNPRIKNLAGYFKLDELDSEYLRDEMDKMRKSFYKPFSESSKVIGKIGFALSFNGLDNFLNLDIPDEILKAKGMTLSAWINTHRTFGKRILFAFGRQDRVFRIFIEDGYYFAEIKGSDKDWIWPTGIEAKRKEWQHITITITHDEIVLLSDLTQTANQKMPVAFGSLIANPIVFGSEIKQALNMFSGELDELKIFVPELPPEFIKGLGDEEDVIQDVSDVDILREELDLIRKERQRLLQQLKEKIEKSENMRLKQVEEINRLISEVQGVQIKMNQPTLVYNYDRGNEKNAILELKHMVSAKIREYEEYKASRALRLSEYQNEFSHLMKEIETLSLRLGKDKSQYAFEFLEGKEEDVLSQMKTFLKHLKDEFLANQKQIEEKEKLLLKEKVIEKVNALNTVLTELKEPLFELADNWEQDLNNSFQTVVKFLNEKEGLLLQRKENEVKREKEQKEKEIREKLLIQYKSFHRDIESLRRELNIAETELIASERSEDTTAVAYLNFEEGKGRLAKDMTGKDNKALFMDYSIAWSKAGVYGGSLQFSGDEGVLKINSSQTLDAIKDFTIAVWLNPERLYGDRCVVHLGQGSMTRLSLILKNENLFLRFDKERLINTGMKINENTWQHLTVMYRSEQSVFQVYVDGVLISEIKAEHSHENLFLGVPVYLGSNGQDDYFSGWIDEFKIFNRALDEADLRENMKEGIPKIDASLDQYALDQLQHMVKDMESELERLRELKFAKDQQELARQEAKRKENIKLTEGRLKLLLSVQAFLKEGLKKKEIPQSTDIISLSEVVLSKDNADLFWEKAKGIRELLNQEHLSLRRKRPQDILSPFQLEAGDPLIFSKIQFEDIDEDKANDSGVSGQFAQGFNMNKWKTGGISGNAIKLGDHGYLTIVNQHKVPYNLKQSLQFWINPSKEIGSKKMLLLQRGSLNIEIEQGILRASFGGDWMYFRTLPRIESDKWQLISIGIDEFAGKLLLGCGQHDVEEHDFKTKFGNPEGSVFIGGAPSESLRYYGLIDEIVIYHRLLVTSDFQHGYMYNESVRQGFCDESLKAVWIEFFAEGVDFMRVYQEGYFTGAVWLPYKKKWIIPVYKPSNKREDVLNVICQLKNRYANEIKEVKVEIPIPYDPGIRFVLPPENVEVTAK